MNRWNGPGLFLNHTFYDQSLMSLEYVFITTSEGPCLVHPESSVYDWYTIE